MQCRDPTSQARNGVDSSAVKGTSTTVSESNTSTQSPPIEDEPRKRKRTVRACEPCRRRKVKCDGKEACAGCEAASIACVYQITASETISKEHAQTFDNRLERLEGMFETFLKKMDVISAPLSGSRDPHSDYGSLHLWDGTPTPAPREVTPDAEEVGNSSSGNTLSSEHLCETPQNTSATSKHLTVGCGPLGPQMSRGSTFVRSAKRIKQNYTGKSRAHTFADAYGELRVDQDGYLRYVGLGSTISVIDACPPFREYLERNVEKSLEGTADPTPSSLASRNFTTNHTPPTSGTIRQLPPAPLFDALVKWFYDRLHFMMPVITQSDFERQRSELGLNTTSGFLSVSYGLLAMAALSFPKDRSIFEVEGWAIYKDANMAAQFYESSVASLRESMTPTLQLKEPIQQPDNGRSLNRIIAVALHASFLASTGRQADAWLCIGQAVRLGQDIGLHRCPARLGFNKRDQQRHRRLWWTVYSLDRALSVTLGRPVAIRDIDCDIGLPDIRPGCEGPSAPDYSGFVAILRLRQILGEISDTVTAVGKVKKDRHFRNLSAIRTEVLHLNSELQTWAALEVPSHVKSASEGNLNAERLIALSGYFSALMLLYRYLVSNPHRPSPLDGSEAVLQCARAATNCIRITGRVIEALPVCPELFFHAQHVFTSSMVLLHCIRRSDDHGIIRNSSKDIELALHSLRRLQGFWPEAKKLICLLETYLELILNSVEKGIDSRQCIFHHEEHETTGLEWGEGIEQCPSNSFPLDFASFTGPELGQGLIPSVSPSNAANGGDGGPSPARWPAGFGRGYSSLMRTPADSSMAHSYSKQHSKSFETELWESFLQQEFPAGLDST